MEGAEGRAREATRRDPLAVYDRYRGGDRYRLKRSASEERMEQVREFDGEQAYEKMMRDHGEGQTKRRPGKRRGPGKWRGQGWSGLGKRRQGKARSGVGRNAADRSGTLAPAARSFSRATPGSPPPPWSSRSQLSEQQHRLDWVSSCWAG